MTTTESNASCAFASARDNLRVRALGVAALVVLASCRETTSTLNTDDYVGHYPLAQIDGRPIGWYHQLNGVNCRAAFRVGSLSISSGQQWRLDLEYDYRCLGAVSGDGEARLGAYGNMVRSTERLIVLNGFGPDPVLPGPINWTIEVRPIGESVEVRFTGTVREFWADPILIMGPRQVQTADH